MKLPSWLTNGFQGTSEKDSLTNSPKGQGQQAKGYVSFASTQRSSPGSSTGAAGQTDPESGEPGSCSSTGDREMARCLTTFDVVSLGVGSACGCGMYLTTGIVAASLAGPAGIFSFLLAGLASMLSGFHFAKLSTIFPNTSGSAYMYTRATVGEFSSFIIGWGLVVEYMIGTSAAAIALSETIDSLTHGWISRNIDHSITVLPSFDPVAGAIVLVQTAVLASGVELSAKVNNLLNLLNLLVLTTFISASLTLGDFHNLTRGRRIRGFFPFGSDGVWRAVPVAYFAFIGFDGLAATGAECKTPGRSIPAGILLSILINTVVYVAVVLLLTVDVEYRLLPEDTAMLDVFPIMGYPLLKYVLAVGAVSGLLAATFGSLFPLPRVVQAMAQDGLIFRYFSHIHPKRQTAMRATVILGTVSAVIAATVDLKFLMELVLIATLLAYVIVTFAVVFILYVKIDTSKEENTPLISVQPKYSEGERAGQYDFDSSHRARETHSKHASKLRLSDSEASDDNAFDEDGESLFVPPSTSRPRSRSATEKHDTIPALNVPSNSSKVRRHSDNAPPNGEEPGSHLKPHGQQTASSIERSKSSCRPNYQKACVPLLRPAALCLSTVARFLCDGRHISDFLKLLMFQSRKQITVLMVCIYAGMFVVCVILCHLSPQLDRGEPVTAVILTVSAGVAVVSTILLVVQPQIQRRGVKAALSPLVSIFTGFINLYLMASLRLMAWGLFIIWMLIGLSIYYFYARNPSWLPCSRAKSRNQERVGLLEEEEPQGDMSTSNPEASSMRVQ